MTALTTFLRAFSGTNVLKFAFVGPAVFLLLVGGIDLLAVSRAQDRLQTIADGAAAVGASALASDMDDAEARASAFVAAEISRWPNAPLYDAKYEIVDRAGRRTVRVVLLGHRTSFLANMLPPGGWKFVGDSSAAAA